MNPNETFTRPETDERDQARFEAARRALYLLPYRVTLAEAESYEREYASAAEAYGVRAI